MIKTPIYVCKSSKEYGISIDCTGFEKTIRDYP